jgi:formylglycine-generating enzyme required for sulfatase activity
MALVKKDSGNYCIDRYEYPGGGSRPRTNVSWFKAKQLCEAKGKRLCELNEWKRACGSKYPYGRKWDPDKCNTVDVDGFERSLAATGSNKKCRSWPGLYDMVGNAHEWTKEQRIAGGGFDSGEDVATCRYSSPKAAGSSAPNIGFRCCANPK